MANVTVLGGGIIGVSVALGLRVLGHQVRILSETTPEEISQRLQRGHRNEQHPVTIASLYPAASVIPYSIQFTDEMTNDFLASQQVFAGLNWANVRQQTHYEVNAPGSNALIHPPGLDKCERLSGSRLHRFTDAFGDVESVWQATVWFVDFPQYFANLVDWTDRLGITCEQQTVDAEFLKRDYGDIVVNCLGYGGPDLDDGEEHRVFQLGCLIRLPHLREQDFRESMGLASWKFNPGPGVHADFEGKTSDLYVYPRSDGAILGGTRTRVTPPNYVPQEYQNALQLNDRVAPASTLSRNVQILERLLGRAINTKDAFTCAGVRYSRGDAAGNLLPPKISARQSNRSIVDCYGFGGSGVAMSWFAAYRVARVIAELHECGTDSCDEMFCRLPQVLADC